MQTIPEQLVTELKRLGWSVDELRKRSGVKITRSALQRKLRGQLRLNVDEALKLAQTMDFVLVWAPAAPAPRARTRKTRTAS